MKIALVSTESKINRPDYNVYLMQEAVKQNPGIDLILFGESFLQGYLCMTWDFESDKKTALGHHSLIFRQIKYLAKTLGVAIGFGYYELEKYVTHSIYNSYCVIDKTGKVIYNYRRRNWTWIDRYKSNYEARYRVGKCSYTFLLNGVLFNCAICADFYDNPMYSDMVSMESDFVLWPCFVVYPDIYFKHYKQSLFPDRMHNVKSPILFINSICYYAGAPGGCAVFHKGKILQELSPGNTGILIVDTDNFKPKKKGRARNQKSK